MNQSSFDISEQPWIAQMLNAMPHPALICEANSNEFHFCLVNPAFEQLFNNLSINQADITHYTFVDFLPWRAAEKAFAALNESVRIGRAIQCNLSQVTEQKIIIQINPINCGESDVDYRLLQFQVLSRDNTNETNGANQLSLTELLLEQLAERERLYHSVFSQAAIGIARLDLTGAFIEVNERLCQHLDYSELELLNLNIIAVISANKDSLSAVLKALINKEISSYKFETQITRRNKTQFWALLTASLVTHANGKPMYLSLMVEDIDTSKNTEKELKLAKLEREHLLNCRALASEAGGICNWSVNLKTQALYWDQHMFDMYGVPVQNDLTYQHWRDTLHPDDIDVTEQAFFHSIESKTPFDCEFRIVNQTTGDIRVIKAAAFVLYEHGEPSEAYGVNIDVTKEYEVRALLQQQAQQAEQASEAKSRFLATMSHEIRTPMNGVVGMIDLLKKTELNAAQTDMVSTIRDSSFALLDIINDVLDFSKIEAGKMVLDKVPYSLLELTEKTCDALWVNAQENQVNMVLEVAPNLPESLILDPVRVRQILMNLMANSIKFCRSHPDKLGQLIVTLNYHPSGCSDTFGYVEIQVDDDGVGMTAEQVDSLFIPFTQADSSTTRKFGGTGLGLTITHSLVEMMGGRIEVTSELGVGSRFSVFIPVKTEAQSAVLIDRDSIENMHIVLEIHDPILRQNCQMVLAKLGIHFQSDPLTPQRNRHGNSIVITDRKSPISTQPIDAEQGTGKVLYLLPKSSVSGDDTSGFISSDYYQLLVNFIKPSLLIEAFNCLIDDNQNKLIKPNRIAGDKNVKPFCIDSQFTILVAEDHPTNRKVLASQLDQLGLSYDMCCDGLQAWQHWQSGNYPLVLTDCHMPNMDGYELTKRIRASEGQTHSSNSTVIIAITANAMAGVAEQALAQGFNDYLTKPLEMVSLKRTLFNWFARIVDSHDQVELTQSELCECPAQDTPNSQAPSLPNAAIDYPHLIAVIGMDDEVLIKEILQLFWQSLEHDLVQIKQLLSSETSNKSTRLKQLAHGAKGASHSSGALELAKLFKQLELCSDDSASVKQCIIKIDFEVERIIRQLCTDGILEESCVTFEKQQG